MNRRERGARKASQRHVEGLRIADELHKMAAVFEKAALSRGGEGADLYANYAKTVRLAEAWLRGVR
jgi:hypothetical protein